MDEMVRNEHKYFAAGQVRSLPYPTLWTRCDFRPGGAGGCVPAGTYQNGAYWATPLVYVTKALIQTGHASFAEKLLQTCVQDFKANGIYEDVDYGLPVKSRGVLNYTASVTNVLWAANLLEAHRREQGW